MKRLPLLRLPRKKRKKLMQRKPRRLKRSQQRPRKKRRKKNFNVLRNEPRQLTSRSLEKQLPRN